MQHWSTRSSGARCQGDASESQGGETAYEAGLRGHDTSRLYKSGRFTAREGGHDFRGKRSQARWESVAGSIGME